MTVDLTADHLSGPLDDSGDLSEEAERDFGAARDAAARLAEQHQDVRQDLEPPPLLDRPDVYESLFRHVRDYFGRMSETQRALSYAAEWVLDNFYLIQQALRQVREDMPPGYYRKLPTLTGPSLSGYPRVYVLAREIVWKQSSYIEQREHQLDLEQAARFIEVYQRDCPLTMGELWALPTMFRLSVLERLAQALARAADLSVADDLPGDGGVTLPADLADDVIVANSILSLRALSTQDWRAFFERLSAVETTLRRDPAHIYAHMDFETRDRYRSVVEELAEGLDCPEGQVAQAAVDLAKERFASLQDSIAPSPGAAREDADQVDWNGLPYEDIWDVGADPASVDEGGPPSTGEDEWRGLRLPRSVHVGFYLLGEGREQLENRLGYRPSLPQRARRWVFKRPMWAYLGGVLACTLFFLVGILGYAAIVGGTPIQLALVGCLGILPVTSVAINLVNRLTTHLVPPHLLAKLDFEDGAPASCRTMVVIPAILGDSDEVEPLLRQIERHYLGNMDPHLFFGLLTDLTDAPQQHMPGDDEIVERMRDGVQALNQQYGRRREPAFYLLHRDREWNPAEDCWMGWERKRGKLIELNRLLRGESHNYQALVGDVRRLQDIRYVITLDADTVLPKETAIRLIATLAHPLNQADFTPESDAPVAGYSILQPRVEVKPTSIKRSLFSQVFAGDVGIDLYTRAVSDVYQDLFGEGSYVGKGIYDVDAFRRSLAGRVPENALLSHDLFEGVHGRVGLATDVVMYEDYPSNYLGYTRRMHRWIRGDWQLLPWLLPRVPGAGADTAPTRLPNTLSVLDRWKIVDNLRRSLMKPALFALLISGWFLLPGAAWLWTAFGVLTMGVPASTGFVTSLLQGVRQRTFKTIWRSLSIDLLRWGLTLAFLPYESFIAVDAIVTTLVRLTVTRKRLLQWTTSAHTFRLFGKQTKLGLLWQKMGLVALFALALTLGVSAFNRTALLPAAPLLFLWVESPQIAYWISRALVRRQARRTLTESQRRQLRRLARRMWLYFEQFVGPEDHWLPPDHFQEDPRGLAARRTSPTNLGLALLSTLGAHDLGYIGGMGLALRLRLTFESMESLAWYRGHFLNWYDTSDLKPLLPRYVSTVDSGNLAACLLALRQGLLALPEEDVIRRERWQGFLDALGILGEIVAEIDERQCVESVESLDVYLASIRGQVTAALDQPATWSDLLDRLIGETWEEMQDILLALVACDAYTLDVTLLGDLRIWVEHVTSQLENLHQEVGMLAPWISALSQAPRLFDSNGMDEELSAAWSALRETFSDMPSLADAPRIYRAGERRLGELQNVLDQQSLDDLTRRIGPEAEAWLQEACDWRRRLVSRLRSARLTVETLVISYQDLAGQADAFFRRMDFSFLFNEQRQVFHIGYNVDAETLDGNFYDLMASEARIASLLTIAKGDAPQRHWINLARPITQVEGHRALLSWGGSMFEYLMPPLLMQTYEDTLLEQSCQAAVAAHIAYARRRGVPWGISESGYYRFDAQQNYQYRGFGVPGLGFKRGLSDDLVIAPYASLLALSVDPQAVMRNVQRLIELGMLGRYGLYEAIDYTSDRLSSGQKRAIVRSYMVHHHGMSLLSILNHLQEDAMVRRFHADPRIQSVQLLLQEHIPHQAPVEEQPHPEEFGPLQPIRPTVDAEPWPAPVDTVLPHTHALSNGRYTVYVTARGGGYSAWQGIALNRWRADATLDCWGVWVYVQEHTPDGQNKHEPWSIGLQPTGMQADRYEAIFHIHQVEFRRQAHETSARMEVVVSPDDDVELRRITLTNHSDEIRRFTLTSFGELSLAPLDADRRHPAFSKLFVESEYVADLNCLLFRRRPRSAEEQPVWAAHALVLELGPGRAVARGYESDRARFLGRGRELPAALDRGPARAGATGATLDPIMSLAQTFDLPAHTTAQFAYLTVAARSRREALTLVRRYRVWSTSTRAFNQARACREIELHRLDLDGSDVARIQQLLSALLYPSAVLRADPTILASNTRGQPALWSHAISGDYPILLLRIYEEDGIELARQALQAHVYWRNRQIDVDLVILNERESGYDQQLQGRILRLIDRMNSSDFLNQRGGVFVLRADQMSAEEKILLQTVARVVLDSRRGTLYEQAAAAERRPDRLPAFTPISAPHAAEMDASVERPLERPIERPDGLRYDNGLGGFSRDGREYVIYLEPGQSPPNPWINVIANADFGCLVSEAGLGYTWAVNSGENKLTPWRNDPLERAGCWSQAEAIYLRDEETGDVWSPTPSPAGQDAACLIRHAAGYSTFERHSHGIEQMLRVYVVPDAPLKVVHLRLRNKSQRNRRITATYYAEWVLGPNRDVHQQFVAPEFDAVDNVLMARNAYNEEFAPQVAFLSSTRAPHGLTTDRAEFLGRGGDYRRPDGLKRIALSNRVRVGDDPCAAFQVVAWLAPDETEDVFFLLGQGRDRADALRLVKAYQDPEKLTDAWQASNVRWERLLETITVQTPDPAMDLMLNRWLLYQTLACRVWGRSALYQSSGAFGYRDQLQDVMALVHAAPDLARDHILRAARHQFEEGDVLHWWHPPSGRGVRTRCSDDLLWLPFVVAHYVETVGDADILDAQAPFLTGDPLSEEEHERYGHYETTAETYPLYEHCLRAIEKGATSGPHGLPLIGSHDWNDGFNRVGVEGRGESVWLGWFLYATWMRFAPLCEARGDVDLARRYREQAEALRVNLEKAAWDEGLDGETGGTWYRRAYYDDGTPLGSAVNEECQIDSLAQSWAVLSGAADPERAAQAMEALYERLARPDERLILLFTPPFDETPHDPGYVKGYLPGIRENGGQYTHAALWAVWAFAELGQGERAAALFRMLNPVYHADSAEKVARYRVEPYVVAADVYSVEPHVGRGGWTWYTGSSGWMYRLGVEAILGVRREGDSLYVDPCIPRDWEAYTVIYRDGAAYERAAYERAATDGRARKQPTVYHIRVENPHGVNRGVMRITLDGEDLPGRAIPLTGDGRRHEVLVTLARASTRPAA